MAQDNVQVPGLLEIVEAAKKMDLHLEWCYDRAAERGGKPRESPIPEKTAAWDSRIAELKALLGKSQDG